MCSFFFSYHYLLLIIVDQRGIIYRWIPKIFVLLYAGIYILKWNSRDYSINHKKMEKHKGEQKIV
uniref:Uncharacterized protein n=1 Tax=Anguilla anguilla TaxID=7936 RepID=A0A0E9XDB9_ANGAN